MEVEQMHVGRIMGRSGSTIQRIQSESVCVTLPSAGPVILCGLYALASPNARPCSLCV